MPPRANESENSATAAIGRNWVFSSHEGMDLYRDAYLPFSNQAEDRMPTAAVAPDSAEQVQQILRIAYAYKIPLWSISTTKKLGYGGGSSTR